MTYAAAAKEPAPPAEKPWTTVQAKKKMMHQVQAPSNDLVPSKSILPLEKRRFVLETDGPLQRWRATIRGERYLR